MYENSGSRKSKHLLSENKYVLCIETRFKESGGEEEGGDGNPRILSREDSLPWGKVKKTISRVER